VALTYTLAGLRAALDSCETDILARNWAGAVDGLSTYTVIYHGLPQGSKADASFTFPSPRGLREAVTAAQEIINRTGGRPRQVFTRCDYSESR